MHKINETNKINKTVRQKGWFIQINFADEISYLNMMVIVVDEISVLRRVLR